MNNIDKVILLAENFGVDVSRFTSSYVEGVVKSEAYKVLVENVEWAQQFNMKKSNMLVYDFKSINYNISTFAESITLASRINYLSELSFEQYYLNPLCIKDYKVKTKSIGKLMTMYDSKQTSFNDIIADTEHQINYKANAITKQVEYYKNEAIDKYIYPLEKTHGNEGMKSIVRKSHLVMGVYSFFALIATAFIIYICMSNKENVRNSLLKIDFKSLWFYGVYALLILSALYLIAFVLLACYFSRNLCLYSYYKKFYKRKKAKIISNINKTAQSLAEYIFNACLSSTLLDNDIYKFSSIKAADVDLSNYKRMYDVFSRAKYKLLKTACLTLLVLILISCFYIGGIYIYQHFIVG